jgi:hypothetical protein
MRCPVSTRGVRRLGAGPGRTSPAFRDLASGARIRRSGRPPLAGTGRRHLGDPWRRRAPRALQADGLARPGPGPAHRRHPPARRATTPPVAARTRRHRTEVRARGFDPAKTTYVRDYDSTELGAALLGLPLLGIDDLDSPRVRGTSEAIRDELSAGGPLLYRYSAGRDGLPGTEGAFLPCSSKPSPAPAASPKRSSCSKRCSFDRPKSRAEPSRVFAERLADALGCK